MTGFDSNTVVVVGTGVTGLTIALRLVTAGYQVRVLARGPDPRQEPTGNHRSSTLDGELGRFFTAFEGHPYLGDSPMYPRMQDAFATLVSEGGWLGKPEHQCNQTEIAWLQRRRRHSDSPALKELGFDLYARANLLSMEMWQELIRSHPLLFVGCDLKNQGVLRLYGGVELFHWAAELHEKYGVLKETLEAPKLARKHPAFSYAAENALVTGALEVEGFSFNIKCFIRNAISYLEENGVSFQWEVEVLSFERNSTGEVSGLAHHKGVHAAKHFVLGAGAYSNPALFAGTDAEGRIGGVAGRWLIMPRPAGMSLPVKIHDNFRTEGGRDYPVVDVNLTPYENDGNGYLAIGGGYAYLGEPPFEFENEELFEIDRENHRTIRTYLRPAYEAAVADAALASSRATCVRSFTDNDIPLDVTHRTASGGVLKIIGGTNTGTATIAPFFAEVVFREISEGKLEVRDPLSEICESFRRLDGESARRA